MWSLLYLNMHIAKLMSEYFIQSLYVSTSVIKQHMRKHFVDFSFH